MKLSYKLESHFKFLLNKNEYPWVGKGVVSRADVTSWLVSLISMHKIYCNNFELLEKESNSWFPSFQKAPLPIASSPSNPNLKIPICMGYTYWHSSICLKSWNHQTIVKLPNFPLYFSLWIMDFYIPYICYHWNDNFITKNIPVFFSCFRNLKYLRIAVRNDLSGYASIYCYGLNCVSPKFICWNPNLKCDCIWRRAFRN